MFQVVQHWVDVSHPNIRILAEVPIAVEEFGRGEQSNVFGSFVCDVERVNRAET